MCVKVVESSALGVLCGGADGPHCHSACSLLAYLLIRGPRGPRKGESRKGRGLGVLWRCGHGGFFFFLIDSASLRGLPRLLESTVPKLHSPAGAVLGGERKWLWGQEKERG